MLHEKRKELMAVKRTAQYQKGKQPVPDGPVTGRNKTNGNRYHHGKDGTIGSMIVIKGIHHIMRCLLVE